MCLNFSNLFIDLICFCHVTGFRMKLKYTEKMVFQFGKNFVPGKFEILLLKSYIAPALVAHLLYM